MALRKCPNCGRELSTKTTHCVFCNYPISSDYENNQPVYDGEPVVISQRLMLNAGGPIFGFIVILLAIAASIVLGILISKWIFIAIPFLCIFFWPCIARLVHIGTNNNNEMPPVIYHPELNAFQFTDYDGKTKTIGSSSIVAVTFRRNVSIVKYIDRVGEICFFYFRYLKNPKTAKRYLKIYKY